MSNTLYQTPSTAALVVHWLLIELDAQRMKARPAFQETYRREGLTDWT
ncbi:glutathione S-transferase [Xanthomonas fragariae]|uniref:Glutathione S-transferase n=1 Tax=Xanthomonas fragariae TaxID=48664 RepID=A0A1Y6HKD4_9XANT|nr:glutathione S-transferase [Xanthomonas fragariae LMG 25863]SMQ99857.1 hypothetical protein PD885_02626 [Xanthomonas fragariae]SMR02690.1 glutathione S-transferase [Xanthomonas fragariae]